MNIGQAPRPWRLGRRPMMIGGVEKLGWVMRQCGGGNVDKLDVVTEGDAAVGALFGRKMMTSVMRDGEWDSMVAVFSDNEGRWSWRMVGLCKVMLVVVVHG
ncbi:hypothetical protein SESBI_42528 [Sesbania bispinosa]|nr:hypothetical protein SESBI_42528 [Sesbania bispinosa]